VRHHLQQNKAYNHQYTKNRYARTTCSTQISKQSNPTASSAHRQNTTVIQEHADVDYTVN